MPVLALVDEDQETIERVATVPGQRFIDRETMHSALRRDAGVDARHAAQGYRGSSGDRQRDAGDRLGGDDAVGAGAALEKWSR